MSMAKKERAKKYAAWAASLGLDGCRKFMVQGAIDLMDLAGGHRRSSAAASEQQAKMAACRKYLRSNRRQGQQKTEQGIGA